MKHNQFLYRLFAIAYAIITILWKIFQFASTELDSSDTTTKTLTIFIAFYGFCVIMYAYYYIWTIAESLNTFFVETLEKKNEFPIWKARLSLTYLAACFVFRTVLFGLKTVHLFEVSENEHAKAILSFEVIEVFFNSQVGPFGTCHIFNILFMTSLYFLADLPFQQSKPAFELIDQSQAPDSAQITQR